MNTATLAACLFLGVFMVNFLHWRFHKEERWLYFPQRGWLKVIAHGGIIAMISFAVASLAGWMVPSTFPLIMLPVSIAQQLYSIWIRQAQRPFGRRTCKLNGSPSGDSMTTDARTKFQKLNDGWNAEPNAPNPEVTIEGRNIVVTFLMNPFEFPQFSPEDVGRLRFISCGRYRLGPTNDEGWFRGQCRFTRFAPEWGEFYELTGDLRLAECPDDWVEVAPAQDASRHFLFYFRDETFECDAAAWSFELLEAKQSSTATGGY